MPARHPDPSYSGKLDRTTACSRKLRTHLLPSRAVNHSRIMPTPSRQVSRSPALYQLRILFCRVPVHWRVMARVVAGANGRAGVACWLKVPAGSANTGHGAGSGGSASRVILAR
jgi:hypothetical protein